MAESFPYCWAGGGNSHPRLSTAQNVSCSIVTTGNIQLEHLILPQSNDFAIHDFAILLPYFYFHQTILDDPGESSIGFAT